MNKKGIVGWILLGLLGCFLLVGLIYGAKYLWLTPKTVISQIDSAGNIIEQTYDADNAIYNYEWFKTQFEKIQANRNQIQNAKDSITSFKETFGNSLIWDYSTKEEYNRLNTILMGLKNQEENLVADYNAKSKMANRNVFKDKLPVNVDKMIW